MKRLGRAFFAFVFSIIFFVAPSFADISAENIHYAEEISTVRGCDFQRLVNQLDFIIVGRLLFETAPYRGISEFHLESTMLSVGAAMIKLDGCVPLDVLPARDPLNPNNLPVEILLGVTDFQLNPNRPYPYSIERTIGVKVLLHLPTGMQDNKVIDGVFAELMKKLIDKQPLALEGMMFFYTNGREGTKSMVFSPEAIHTLFIVIQPDLINGTAIPH